MIVIPAPVLTGINSSRNPVISGCYENTGHRFSPPGLRHSGAGFETTFYDIINYLEFEISYLNSIYTSRI